MKLCDHFKSFMKDSVNLNSTRLDLLEGSVETLKEVTRNSDWPPTGLVFAEQGSWAHKTIIKPVEGNAFDADLLVVVNAVKGWEAKQYLSTLRAVFADHGTYKDKVARSSHCVTITYAGERKVDLVPCIRDRNGVMGHEVCNYNENVFERSEPEAFTDWLHTRATWAGSGALKKVTRLLKYLRDVKGNFTCPSVLLTTLLGMQISYLDSIDTDPFADTPTALKTIMNRLDDWLQARATKPRVPNPVLSTELFSDFWTEEQYSNFRERMNLYRTWIDDAFNEVDRDESIGKWRRVFGDDFASAVAIEKAASVTDTARTWALSSSLVVGAGDDLVGLIRRFGLSILPAGFNRLPHKQRPKWRVSPHGGYTLKVSAALHESEKGAKIKDVTSGQGPLPKRRWLRFIVREVGGAAFSDDKYKAYWRITNTDHEAVSANSMRGGFEKPNDGTSRWEGLQYRGVHTAEAFVIRRRDNMLVGQSDPFYVVVE
jgi:hypothetical protein